MINTVKTNWKDVGLVYLCNPNNPTGPIVTAAEIKTLLDGIPNDVPVLIDEAYHHFVNDPAYATSIPYSKQGREARECYRSAAITALSKTSAPCTTSAALVNSFGE